MFTENSSNTNLLRAIEAGGYTQNIHDRIIENEKLERELIKSLDNAIRKQQASTITAELLSAMLEDAKTKIFILKDEIETKNLIQRFVNQVIVYENEIQVSLNLILDTNG